MLVYPWLLFGHLLGVALLLAGVGAYAASVEQLRRTTTVQEVRALLGVATLGERLLQAGGPFLIGAGLGLAAGFWSFSYGWIATSIGLVALQAVPSLILELRIRPLRAAARKAPDGPLETELRRATRDPLLPVADRVSGAVIVEIIFLMVVKPAPLAILGSLLVAAGAAVLACLPLLGLQRRRAGDGGEHSRAPGGAPRSPSSRPAEAAADPRPAPAEEPGRTRPTRRLAASPDDAGATAPSTAGVVPLDTLRQVDSQVAGAKAATLGELAGAGLPVPDGFVVLGQPDEEAVLRAAAARGDVPLAVRSSAIAEDLANASFAGQYETVLDVRGADALLAAIRRVRDSARSARVQHYRAARPGVHDAGIAVLVQRMLAPEAAGVAFTANPVTGQRGEVVITAARGLGERVVSGEAVGDEWLVRGGEPVRRRAAESAIGVDQARAIAQLARRVETHLGVPQDIEWAIEGGRLYLLQARPMTALPEPVDWTPPSPGYWLRSFRLGEWLPEPMTPLFQDWLLERIEQGYLVGMRRAIDAAVPWRHAAINGWYYTAPPGPRSIPFTLLRALLQSRGRILPFLLNALIRVNRQPEAADRAVLGRLARDWREELLPRYRRLAQQGERQVDATTPGELAELVDVVGRTAGECLWSLAIVGGSAWKMEACLARFLRQHVPAAVYGNVPALLRGLPGADPDVPAHAVQSVDWYWPTAGELGWQRQGASPDERRQQLQAERQAAEVACRSALADQPAALARFDVLLELAQRYAVLREEQARWFTLGWPLLRRCALRLGGVLVANGAIDRAEDVFFLTRAELPERAPLQEAVERRRATWERQRRLVAPLTLGRAPFVERAIADAANAVRADCPLPEDAIVGQPASPGRATGPVRVVRGPEDFDRFQPGEVLVARATAPAWTPLFGRAAAVVTDGGTLAAHASLVAREYGIPAVVGTGDATVRLHDGQVVVVDGSAGAVLPRPPLPGSA